VRSMIDVVVDGTLMSKTKDEAYPFAPSPSEHIVYVNNFQPRPNHDPYSNTYNRSWKHHPNFFYRTKPRPFPKLLLGLYPLDFKDHPCLNKLH